MLAVLAHPAYRNLFAAQALSLLGSGLTTVALGLAAYQIAGADAGVVLGVALALKMIAYVGLAPLAAALAERLPRRRFLVALDLARMALTALLPFVDQTWQIYALVFLYQACSSAFTPTFQALIPDVLPDERDYARALSLSRFAYDAETIASPLIAGALLSVMSYSWLFVGTAAGFAASAALVAVTSLPSRRKGPAKPFLDRAAQGLRIYLATPRLRGVLALYGAVATASAMVIVNTVVHVKTRLGGDDALLAAFLAAYGIGSAVVALAMPRLLDRHRDRSVMMTGGIVLVVALAAGRAGVGLAGGLALWAALGAAVSAVGTPVGLVLRRSAAEADRTAVFAAQFALSHACWLVAYPAAGLLGAAQGLDATFGVFAIVSAASVALAAWLWPADDPPEIAHSHPPHGDAVHEDDHAGLAPSTAETERGHVVHAHAFVIDDLHPTWPRQ